MNRRCFYTLVIFFNAITPAISQKNRNLNITARIGTTYHTPLVPIQKNNLNYSTVNFLSPSAQSDNSFERFELKAGIGVYLPQNKVEVILAGYLGIGSYGDEGGPGSSTNTSFYRQRLFWTQGIHVNKYNKPQARHVFYYGAGFNVLNIGKQFDAKLKSSIFDPDPVDVTVQMQAVSFSAQMGRSIGKNGFSRNLMLELKAEYIPQWGQYLYTQEIKWLRFGTSLYYRFHLSEKQKKKQKL